MENIFEIQWSFVAIVIIIIIIIITITIIFNAPADNQ
jgi:hypothetical protein